MLIRNTAFVRCREVVCFLEGFVMGGSTVHIPSKVPLAGKQKFKKCPDWATGKAGNGKWDGNRNGKREFV